MNARAPSEHTWGAALQCLLNALPSNGWFGPAGFLLSLVTPLVLWLIAKNVTQRLHDESRERDDRLRTEARERDDRLKLEERERDLRIKRIESTLEFSKRFQELIRDRRELNRKFSDAHKGNKDAEPTPAEKDEGLDWWWAFFDLILYEFDFFQRGLVSEERFIEWMRWRWYDFKPKEGEKSWKTSGVTYQEGWHWWSTLSAQGNRLIELLTEIHRAERAEEVPDIVRRNARQPGQQTALEADARRQ
jgi:hypothetical protein